MNASHKRLSTHLFIQAAVEESRGILDRDIIGV